MIVVDSTVWIDFLEARETSFDLHLKQLIADDAPVALTDVIYCEVLQGIRDESTFLGIRDLLRQFPIMRVSGLQTFDHAASIYRSCRKRGFTIRSTVDCVIAATCLEAGAELYHNDRDFETIAKVHGLQIHRP
ncbi:MAG: type II toxin-antitoxin system VapC family toxin [Nitrospiraceae bacterium]